MHSVKLVTNSKDWEGLYVNDKIVYQCHIVPRDMLVKECVKHNTVFIEVEVDIDFIEKNLKLPDDFKDIPSDVIINPEVLVKTVDKELTAMDLQLLESDGWMVNCEYGEFKIHNRQTGCYAEGDWAKSFICDKLEELREDSNNPIAPDDLSLDEFFTKHNFTLLCESPLEIEDSNGKTITGECALFVKSCIMYH